MPRATPKKQLLPVEIKTILLIVGVCAISFLIWWFGGNHEQGLKVWMLDVGQGDAFFIEFPNKEQMLIDAGADDTVLSKIGNLMLPWDKTLDAILITHPDADHITGFVSILDRYNVETIYGSGAIASTPQDTALQERIENESLEHVLVEDGDVIQFGDVTLTVVWPDQTYEASRLDDRNAASVVFRLDYGETSILFTGDAEEESEIQFISDVGNIDILKVGHHGSLSSTSWDLLEVTQPEAALISAGEDNRYGHPHPTILSRLEDWECDIYRTDIHGDVLVTSNGGEPMVYIHPLPF